MRRRGDDPSLNVQDRRAWADPASRAPRADPGNGLVSFPLVHADRCIRRARFRLDRVELRDDRGLRRVERGRRLERVLDLVQDLVDRLVQVGCCLVRARLRAEHRGRRLVLDSGAEDRGTRRVKKAR